MPQVKSVAVIGAGPAGAITIDALVQEQAFDKIRVFERREKPGGCWLADPPIHKQPLDIDTVITRDAVDPPVPLPESIPTKTKASNLYRHTDTSIYPFLETNISSLAMQYSAEPFPSDLTSLGRQRHGDDSPFRHWSYVQQYIENLITEKGYDGLVRYNTTVEHVIKSPETNKWAVTTRTETIDERTGERVDLWSKEEFDAVVVANGHYNIPYIHPVPGLVEFAKKYPGAVSHSKSFRDPTHYEGKRVVVVGASISGADISSFVAPHAKTPLISVVRGKYHPYFFDYAFQHPNIVRRPPIKEFICEEDVGEGKESKRKVVFEDGTYVEDVDHVIFGTGYTWAVPFLRDAGVEVRNNRIPGLYQHVFWREDPSLCFVGAIAAGFTFKVYEWQAVLCARFLANRISLPPLSSQISWESARIERKGDGVPFTALYPYFEEYFEEIRGLAGEPQEIETEGQRKVVGRKLPRFEKGWREDFDRAHLKRIAMWQRENEEARRSGMWDDVGENIKEVVKGSEGEVRVDGGFEKVVNGSVEREAKMREVEEKLRLEEEEEGREREGKEKEPMVVVDGVDTDGVPVESVKAPMTVRVET